MLDLFARALLAAAVVAAEAITAVLLVAPPARFAGYILAALLLAAFGAGIALAVHGRRELPTWTNRESSVDCGPGRPTGVRPSAARKQEMADDGRMMASNVPGRRVVVGVDGSDSALRAVRWAAEDAGRRGVPLRLVHTFVPLTSYAPRAVDPRTLHTAMRDRGREWLDQASAVAAQAGPGLSVDAVLVEASPVTTLVRESRDAALVVLGSRGLGGFTGLLVGSTAVGLAGRARCPVVVVRGAYEETAGPVVVGVDGTPTGEAAIAFAFAEAAARGAELVAVHAWTDLLVETAVATSAGLLDLAPVEQQAEELLAERLAGWGQEYPDVRVTREVVHDRPARALLRHAEHARLLVVGSRGRGGFRALVLGSTSQHLLYHAPCPVVVVRTTPES